jgi:hypothetical protein
MERKRLRTDGNPFGDNRDAGEDAKHGRELRASVHGLRVMREIVAFGKWTEMWRMKGRA